MSCMWKDAGAPPKITGVPGRTVCAIVSPESTSAVCSTSAPIVVVGEIIPSSSTGTTSIGIPHSAQSMMFAIGSSPQRSGVFGQQVKTAIGFFTRSSLPERNIAISSAIRGTPQAVKAPETIGRFECASTR